MLIVCIKSQCEIIALLPPQIEPPYVPGGGENGNNRKVDLALLLDVLHTYLATFGHNTQHSRRQTSRQSDLKAAMQQHTQPKTTS